MPTVIPSAFRYLVDDAAIFPPGLAALPDAVSAHAAHRASPYADLVGPFITDAARLDALADLGAVGLRVSVVVPTANAIAGAVRRCDGTGLVLVGLEVRIAGPEDVATIAAAAPAGIAAYVEAPRPTSADWPAVLNAVVSHGLRLKLRTGGTEAGAFPTEDEVATWISAAVAHGLPFKCTAGLHHATRHTSATTGFEHHGYLNVLLATARAAAGGDVTGALAERDARTLAAAVRALPEAALVQARRGFTSYGSCSILEPLDDLTSLHLIPTEESVR